MACLLTAADDSTRAMRHSQPERPLSSGGTPPYGEDPAEANTELAVLVAAISDDVHGRAAIARDSVRADFARRINHARKHISGFARAAAVSALADARKTALALISQNAALEIAGRVKDARAAFSKKAAMDRAAAPRLTKYEPSAPNMQ